MLVDRPIKYITACNCQETHSQKVGRNHTVERAIIVYMKGTYDQNKKEKPDFYI